MPEKITSLSGKWANIARIDDTTAELECLPTIINIEAKWEIELIQTRSDDGEKVKALFWRESGVVSLLSVVGLGLWVGFVMDGDLLRRPTSSVEGGAHGGYGNCTIAMPKMLY